MKRILLHPALLAFFLLLALGAGAGAAPPSYDAPRLTLNGPWTLKSTRNFPDEGARISQLTYALQGWLHAVVPGSGST